MRRRKVLGYIGLFLLGIASPVQAKTSTQKVGMASYYGHELGGRRTASGARFNPNGFTAAHRTLPFGTRLKVVNIRNGRSVVVTVTDRGPFVKGRIIDLSLGAARAIGMVATGTSLVKIQTL